MTNHRMQRCRLNNKTSHFGCQRLLGTALYLLSIGSLGHPFTATPRLQTCSSAPQNLSNQASQVLHRSGIRSTHPPRVFFVVKLFPRKLGSAWRGRGGGGRLHPTTTQTSARRCLHRLCAQTKHRFVFQPVRCLLGLSPCNLVSCERVIVSKGVFVCVCVCLCVCACACVRCASVSCVK